MVTRPCQRAPRRAAVLLEVLVASSIFTATALVVVGSLSTGLRTAAALAAEAQAENLAVSLLAEIELGIVSPLDVGPEAMAEPHADWTWEIRTAPVEAAPELVALWRVEAIVRNERLGLVRRIVTWAEEPDLDAAPVSEDMSIFLGGRL